MLLHIVLFCMPKYNEIPFDKSPDKLSVPELMYRKVGSCAQHLLISVLVYFLAHPYLVGKRLIILTDLVAIVLIRSLKFQPLVIYSNKFSLQNDPR